MPAIEDPYPEPFPSSTSEDPIVVDKILLVNTENVTHDEYEQTTELKVNKTQGVGFDNILLISLGVDCRTGENYS